MDYKDGTMIGKIINESWLVKYKGNKIHKSLYLESKVFNHFNKKSQRLLFIIDITKWKNKWKKSISLKDIIEVSFEKIVFSDYAYNLEFNLENEIKENKQYLDIEYKLFNAKLLKILNKKDK